MRKLLLKLLLIVFPLVMGMFFVVFGIRNHTLGKQSESWPSVQGNLAGESTSSRKKKRIHISYEYRVNGINYKSSRVNFQGDKASKKQIRSQYNVGDSLVVFYNPADPEQSVLQRGATLTSLLMKLFGALFCFGMSAFFIFSRKL